VSPSPTPRMRSKTWATWLALLGGVFGAQRFYLHGWRDALAWLHWPPTLLGLAGALRMANLGQDDGPSELLLVLLGLMLTQAMLGAILIGLTPDARWAQRWQQAEQATGWAPVLGVIAALLLGGTALMSTLAFGGQKLFEWQQAQQTQAELSHRTGSAAGAAH
jgi:hypothetical protein